MFDIIFRIAFFIIGCIVGLVCIVTEYIIFRDFNNDREDKDIRILLLELVLYSAVNMGLIGGISYNLFICAFEE